MDVSISVSQTDIESQRAKRSLTRDESMNVTSQGRVLLVEQTVNRRNEPSAAQRRFLPGSCLFR